MFHNDLPLPRRSAEAIQHLGQPVTMACPFDPRVKLHINPVETEFYIQFHVESSPENIESMTELAWTRGYCEDAGSDPYDVTVMIDETTMRTYLCSIEAVRDTPLEENLPDLTKTAYGPHSGFMEAVSA